SGRVVLNPNFTTAAHNWSVEVINPDGKSSGQFQFAVQSPSSAAPAINPVTTKPLTDPDNHQPVRKSGVNVMQVSNVTLPDLTAGHVFPNRAISAFASDRVVINPNFTMAAHNWSVEIINPDGQSSGQFQFAVQSPSSGGSADYPGAIWDPAHPYNYT